MRSPSYRRHASGQARVTINGQDHYLGKYGTKSSREKYKRLIAEYKASQKSVTFGRSNLLLQDVLLAFLRYAKEYYQGTTNPYRFKTALRPVADLYAGIPADKFGPVQFKAVRQEWIDGGDRCRRYINEQMGMVLRFVRWAVSEELMPPEQLTKLEAVAPLEKGRTKAVDRDPVTVVPQDLIDQTLAILTPVQADMVRFQLATGCRPGELVQICPAMVDRSGEVWTIKLSKHKTAHKGKQRTIYVGPKAQAILAPYLLRAENDPCFSPIESEQQRRQARHEARKTPLSCGNRPGSNVARKPRVKPGKAFTAGSYRKAIYYACKRAKLPTWSPNQLRHNAATEIRREHGLEAAAVILGHTKVTVTQVYAEQDRTKAVEVARLIG